MKNKKPKGYRIYGDLIQQHRPTIRSLILDILYKKFIKREKAKLSIYREDAKFQTPEQGPNGIPAKFLAVVIDNKVVDLLKMHPNAARNLLSEKSVVVEYDPSKIMLKIGMTYSENSKDQNEKD